MRRADNWIISYWLPFGLLAFLSGFFWAPERHDYKLLVSYSLLLPALLSTFNIYAWKTIAGKPIFWLALTYLAYMTMVGLFRQNENASEYIKWSWYVALFLFAIGLRMRISQEHLAKILLIATSIAAGSVLYAVARDYTSNIMAPGYRLTGYGALYNPLRSSHLFGAFTCIAIWYAFNHREQRWLNKIAWTTAAICFTGVVLTGSRSPLFALFILATLIALYEIWLRRRAYWLCVLIAVSGMLMLFFGAGLTERGLSLRPDIWRYSWNLITENLWLGAGLNAPLRIPLNGQVFLDPHNIILAVLFRGGILGLSLFTAQYCYALYAMWRLPVKSPYRHLTIALIGYGLLTLQFDGGSLIGRATEFWVLLWLPLAFALREYRLQHLPLGA